MAGPNAGGSPSPTAAEILTKVGTDPKTGLNPGQLQERLSKDGPNALPEEKKSALSAFLVYFWGPIPWMIEAAALMALVVGDWGDFTIIISLLLFNALLGFWEENEASNALDALKNSLALKARVLRSGKWEQVDARTLVPGDIVRLYLGDVVPAGTAHERPVARRGGLFLQELRRGRLYQYRPIRAHGRIASGVEEIWRGRLRGFRRQTGRNGSSDYCDWSEHVFWAHRKTSGRRRKCFSLPEGRNEDR